VPCEPNPDISYGYATDNSGFYVNASSPASTYVLSPTGFKTQSGTLKDTNGNFVTKTINGFLYDYTDTVGRLALRVDTGVTNRIDYKFLDVNGNYQTITMYLTAFNIKTNFACSGVVEYTQNSVSLPTSLSLPNGQSYTFEYEDTPGFSGYKTGRLKKVTFPTGGSYEYAYPAPNNGINCSDGTVINLTRTVNNGSPAVWSYQRTQVGTDWKTKITPPVLPYDTAANISTFTFNSTGRLTFQKYYQGAELSQNLLRTVNTTWAANGTPASKTVILENNQQSKVETDFDTKQNLLESREFHWGSGSPGTLARRRTFTYAAALFNRLTQVLVRDAAGNTKAKTDIFYDETVPASCPAGVPQHDDAIYTCTFNTRGNPTRVRRWKDATNYLDATRTYDSLGNLLSVTDPGSHTINFSYADSYLTGGDRNSLAYLTRITKPVPFNSQTINLKYHYSIGQLAEITDENSRTTSFSFSDDLGVAEPFNRLKKTDFPDGGQIKISYNDVARTMTRTQKRTTSPADDVSVVEQYDQIGLLIQNQLPGGRKVDVSYDPHGRQWKVTNPYVNLTDPTYGEVQTKLDALGRVKAIVRQDGNSAQFTYAGNAVKATDEVGKQGVMEVDALGRATRVCEITAGNARSPKENCGITNFSASEGYVTTCVYDLLNNMTQSSQGGQTRTSTYDFLSRRTASLIPEVSTGTSVTYGYDPDSNLISVTDPRGAVNLEYDELHRFRKKKHGATLVAEYTYDGTAANNAIGRLITDTDGDFGSGADHSDYVYDPLGRILTANRTVSGTPYTIAHQYDFMGNLTQFTYPSGRIVTYAYNASAELSQVHDATSGPGFDYVTGASYSPLGTLQQLNLTNQVSTTLGWNNLARLTSILTQKSGNPALLSLGYSYYANGKVQQIVNQLVTDGRKDEKYTYDELSRLLTAQRGPDTNIQRKYSYDYDRFGNRWLQSLVAGTQGYGGQNTFDSATNRVTSTGFSYDNSGNVTANGPGTSFAFNPENFMTAAGASVSYSVDTQGRRTKKTVSGTTTNYFYSGSVVISEKQGPAWTDYIFFGGVRIAQQSGSNLTSAKFLHADHLSSTRACSDGSGNSLGSCDYEPFGEFQPGAACSNLPTNYRFAGMQWDADAGPNGLYHTWFRYYDVNQGRWMGVDPLSGSPDNPQSADRYAYVLDDPANLTDPLGLFHSCPPGCTPVHGGQPDDPSNLGCYCPGD
jgi:RHS repeat-associated protein